MAIRRIATIKTNEGRHCLACDHWLAPHHFEKSVNHYLQEHGWQLLHVGEQTEFGEKGTQLHHGTVAVVGEPVERGTVGPTDTASDMNSG